MCNRCQSVSVCRRRKAVIKSADLVRNSTTLFELFISPSSTEIRFSGLLAAPPLAGRAARTLKGAVTETFNQPLLTSPSRGSSISGVGPVFVPLIRGTTGGYICRAHLESRIRCLLPMLPACLEQVWQSRCIATRKSRRPQSRPVVPRSIQ